MNLKALEWQGRVKSYFSILKIFTNGLLGVILKCRQTKCLIASFYALSITSLILTLIMLGFYSVTLSYYVDGGGQICDYYYPHWRVVCHNFLSAPAQSSGIGMTAGLVTLIIVELACSIVSVVVSCRAYSKFCSTCDCSDCCTCFGCCECGCAPISMQQNEGQHYGPSIHNNGYGPSIHRNGFPLRSPHEQYQESHPAHIPCNSQRPDAYSFNTRYTNPMSGYSNPCSALVNIFIQAPGASHLISSSNGDGNHAGAHNITIQSHSRNEQERDDQHTQHHGNTSEA